MKRMSGYGVIGRSKKRTFFLGHTVVKNFSPDELCETGKNDAPRRMPKGVMSELLIVTFAVVFSLPMKKLVGRNMIGFF